MGLSKTLPKNLSNKKLTEKVFSDRDYILTFGKYKGNTIDDIMYVNPQYLRWLHDKSEWFCLSQELLDEVDELVENWS